MTKKKETVFVSEGYYNDSVRKVGRGSRDYISESIIIGDKIYNKEDIKEYYSEEVGWPVFEEPEMLTECEWTKSIREFVGSEFATPKGTLLKVTGVLKKKRSSTTQFVLECSECSQDKEMYPYGSIKSDKIRLEQGSIPCRCSKSPTYLPFQQVIRFRKNLLENGKSFKGLIKVKGKYNWDVGYECHICSNDLFVQNDVCGGLFWTRDTALLSLKIVSCRCSKRYQYTQEQREFQLKSLCKKEGLIFEIWVDKYKNKGSKFKWKCLNGHSNVSSVHNFIYHNTRCFNCSKENGVGYGYYKDKVDDQDNLYVLNFNNKYLKVGRSFNVERRIKGLIQESKVRKISIMQLYTGTHQQVYDEEQFIHEKLRELGFEDYGSKWSTETFTMDAFPVIISIMKESSLKAL